MNKVVDYLKAERTEAISELERLFGEDAVKQAVERDDVFAFQYNGIAGLSFEVDVTEEDHIEDFEV